ncbi:aminotransferase class IV [Oceanirhabdus sp. W0125-5]|uniref:aminotransferase class IV n=1 Tax=Oceanirhabdus sp. W0125-5 TaxID=2999116 RepID=UPI0022F314E0|nr:aminotransferase class IV [Oceanirhabdus sp. W0125-5]WBW95999.1 aminotransferase class IV [Oceanirhabdus sp. W0125-5]
MNKDKCISYDDGFFYGRGCFETILIRKEPVFLEEHLNRLNSGLMKLGIDKKICIDEVKEHITKYNCALKIMVSEKNTVYEMRDILYGEEHYEKGFSLKLSKVMRNETSNMTYLKSFNYYDNIIEKRKASSEGFDEVIFLNTKGYIAEGAVSNIFFIKGDKIITPKVECGLLNGIIREKFVEKFKDIINESEITLKEAMECDGAFITNSLMGIMWVNSLGRKKYQRCSLYDELREWYNQLIKKNKE